MKPDLVADVGNSRIKFGRCRNGRVAERASVSSQDEAGWRRQLEAWQIAVPAAISVSGVDPGAVHLLAEWFRRRTDQVQVIGSYQQLPIRVFVDVPGRVGLDRLFNAVAANTRRGENPAIVVDAGTAVTVDAVDRAGAFVGGAIFPGFRLMTQALHDYTALLPLIELPATSPPALGRNTEAAIAGGVFWSIAGGIEALIERQVASFDKPSQVFLTGGDVSLIASALSRPATLWPEMTLEGIRITAESLP
jgi:type III pantothenate kinase